MNEDHFVIGSWVTFGVALVAVPGVYFGWHLWGLPGALAFGGLGVPIGAVVGMMPAYFLMEKLRLRSGAAAAALCAAVTGAVWGVCKLW